MKKIFITFICILFLSIFVALFLNNNYDVPILMYHSIDSTQAKYSSLAVNRELFEKQMRYISNNYNCISLNKLIHLMKNKRSIPRNTVVVTFDDGYENNFTLAYPILKKYNLSATIFVVVENIGKFINNKYFKNVKFMSWKQLKKLSDDESIEIGSHTLSHLYLPELNIKDLKREIFQSKHILESNLDKGILFFSYPTGGFNTDIQNMLKEAGYLAACTTNRGYRKTHKNNDLFALKRIKVTNKDNIFRFWFKVSGFYSLFKRVRDPE